VTSLIGNPLVRNLKVNFVCLMPKEALYNLRIELENEEKDKDC
jgi:hypothetical protein